MKPWKNETSFKTEVIVPQSSRNTKLLKELSGAHLQQIKKASYLQFNFSRAGTLGVVLPDETSLIFDVGALSHKVAETLVVACLNDKTVVGYDLYTSYTFSYYVTQDWRPSCSLNIPTLKRVFWAANPLAEFTRAIPQLMSMTGTESFGEAMEMIFDWDEAGDGSFFIVSELMPYSMAQIFSEAIHKMTFDGSGCLAFEGHVQTDFVRKKSSLLSSTKEKLMEFDLCFLPKVRREFEIASDKVCDELTRLGETKGEWS